MTVKDIYETTNTLPNSFVLESGRRFECETKQNTLGDWISSCWQCEGTKRIHLVDLSWGGSKEEAEHNLMTKLTNP